MKTTGYLFQATIILTWWIGMFFSSEFQSAFEYPGMNTIAFDSVMIPDILVIVILSIIRAYSSFTILEYVILGGVAFGTFYCISLTFATNGGYLPTVLMMLALCYNLFLIYAQGTFRQAETSNIYLNSFKTLIQILCIWSITLILLPYLIEVSFGRTMDFSKGMMLSVGIILLIIFSIIGVASSIAIVKEGQGTPLPMDQTNRLVTTGPYKYIRNPMAVAGIGQGISISIMLNSWPILAYSLLGGILWHFVVKPVEEKDMEGRFGDEYINYKGKTTCWLPKFSAT